MVFPGFAGRIQGNTRSMSPVKRPWSILIMRLLYERSAEKYCATGRDLWVFQKHGAGWLAVWRTMLDLNGTADPSPVSS